MAKIGLEQNSKNLIKMMTCPKKSSVSFEFKVDSVLEDTGSVMVTHAFITAASDTKPKIK
jgi:hypothetical protein